MPDLTADTPAHVLEANQEHNRRHAAVLEAHHERVAAARAEHAVDTHDGLAALAHAREETFEAWQAAQADARAALDALSAAYDPDADEAGRQAAHDHVQEKARARDEAERAHHVAHAAHERTLAEIQHGHQIARGLAERSRQDVKREAHILRVERDQLIHAGDAARRLEALPLWVQSRRELLDAARETGDQGKVDQAQAAVELAERQLEEAREHLAVRGAHADEVRAKWGI